MDAVIISGMGVVSPAGLTLKAFWEGLLTGRPFYGPIPAFADDDRYRIKIGAQIRDFHWARDLPIETYGKASCYSLGAAQRALEDAGLTTDRLKHKRVAVIIGTTMGEIQAEESYTEELCGGDRADTHKFSRQYPSYHIAHAVAQLCQAQGPRYVVPGACAAGNYAVAMAKTLLDSRYADVALVGGVDVFSKVAFAGFQRLLSLTPDLCRPFDKRRKGLVLGEGCGILVMERESERLGRHNYARVLGCGLASNACHMTAPHKEGAGEYLSMRKAVATAGLRVEDIDYISAHGTGTKANDRVEAMAINRLFESSVPVSSLKSILGHSMGAASILEIIACCLMLKRNIILPTANYQTPDEDCPLDVVPNRPREKKLRVVLSNSFAFGGQTSCIALGKPSL